MIKKPLLLLALVSSFMTCVYGMFPQTQEVFLYYVQKLISANVDVNQPIINDSGVQTTLLHEAANCGYNESVQLLISNKARVNAVDSKLQTPLHRAALGSYGDIVQLLINCNAKVNAKDADANTPLHYACNLTIDECSLTTAQALVSAGARVNKRNVWGFTPLHLVLMEEEIGEDSTIAMIELLLNADADINLGDDDGDTPLHLAVIWCPSEIVEFLLKHYANPTHKNREGNTPLHIACALGQIQDVQHLIEYGADITVTNNKQQTPLMALVQKSIFLGKYNNCDYLRQKDYNKLVHCFLMDSLTNIDVCDNTCSTILHYGALYETSSSCKTLALLLRVARHLINTQDNNGFTPLYNALECNNIPATMMLLQAGATTDVRNNQGITPLGYLLSDKERLNSAATMKLAQLLVLYGNKVDPYLLYEEGDRKVSLNEGASTTCDERLSVDEDFIQRLKNREKLAQCSKDILRSRSSIMMPDVPLLQLIKKRELTGTWQSSVPHKKRRLTGL